jgi:hypothetical protein
VAVEKVVFFKNRVESGIEKAPASDTVRRVVTSGKHSIVPTYIFDCRTREVILGDPDFGTLSALPSTTTTPFTEH